MRSLTGLLLVLAAVSMTCQIIGSDLDLKRNQFYIGPEWYYVTRTKEGGTKQQGNLIGVRAGYDRLKRYGWYIGTDALYAYGTLDGHVGDETKTKIRSHFTDITVEGRFGYTFQQKTCYKVALTPFIGIGYMREKNHFIKPSPIQPHYDTYFPYGTIGFLSRIYPWEQIEVGLNFKAKFPFEPHCRVSHDEEIDSFIQNVKEEILYRVDLPITYRFGCQGPFAIGVVPFYEYRHYGSHPNYPSDFFKTQFSIWGMTLALDYQM